MKLKDLFAPLLLCAVLAGCSPKQVDGTIATAPFDPICMNVDAGGYVTVKAWGSGASRAEAINAAYKQALSDILFKGFLNGQGIPAGGLSPLVRDMNAKEKYSYYFTPFFSEGGEYLDYVSDATSKNSDRYQAKSGSRVAMGIVVNVNRNALRQKLINDGIIKP